MNGYPPGPVEQRTAKRIGCKVSDVMDFLDIYSEEYLAFHKEAAAVEAEHLDNDDDNLTEHTERTLTTAEALMRQEAEASARLDGETQVIGA